uniref:G_PROTEIN_RECEP_F1_2 domain-containing protein n=1 Tax=Panagrellus redivivus TaxID=6233 RepID=A0A7E4V8A6_PANRE
MAVPLTLLICFDLVFRALTQTDDTTSNATEAGTAAPTDTAVTFTVFGNPYVFYGIYVISALVIFGTLFLPVIICLLQICNKDIPVPTEK